MKINSNFKAGSLYIIGNFFNVGIQFITIPIFTRILSIDDYGIINTYLPIVGILSMIIGMTLHMAVRAAFIDYEEKINEFLYSITILTIINTFITTVIIYLTIIITRIDIQLSIVFLAIIHSFSSAIISNYSMYLMMKNKYKIRTLLLLIPNLISTIISIIAIIFIFETSKYLGKIIPSSFVTFIFALYILLIIFKNKVEKFSTKYWKYALAISLPIIVHGLSLNILHQSDRIMLTALAGASETGVYSLIYNLSMIASVIIVSLEGVWIPWFTNKMKNSEIEEINHKVKSYIAFISLVILSIILISPEVLKILAPEIYWYGEMIIPPLILSSFIAFIYTLYVNIEHYHKKTIYIAINTIIAAASNIVLNLIFIPEYGIYAAATTTLFSYALSLYLHFLFARKLEKNLFPFKFIFSFLILVLFFSALFYVIIDYPVLRWTIAVLVATIFLIKYKRTIMELLIFKKV